MKKILIILAFCFSYTIGLNAQNANEKIKTALLIVDIQEFYFPSDDWPGLVKPEEASLKAKELLATFRNEELLVVHVRHKSSRGFEIHKNVAPLPGEKVITKTEVNSFLGTDLQDFLVENEISRLVIIGMQTQLCLEAATRAAHDLGYECLVVEDACATRNLEYGETRIAAEEVHAAVLATLRDGGYARVLNLQDFLDSKEKLLYHKIN